MINDHRGLTKEDFARAMPARLRRRLMKGQFETGEDIAALRRFVRLTQVKFAEAMGISVHTLRNWEQDRRRPRRSGSRAPPHRRSASEDPPREPGACRLSTWGTVSGQ